MLQDIIVKVAYAACNNLVLCVLLSSDEKSSQIHVVINLRRLLISTTGDYEFMLNLDELG